MTSPDPVVAVTCRDFAVDDDRPMGLLAGAGFAVRVNTTGRRLSADEIVEIAADAVGIVAGTEPFHEDLLERLGALRVLSRCGRGVDNMDVAAAARRGIPVLRTPGAPAPAVAEPAPALILSLARRVPLHDRLVRSLRGPFRRPERVRPPEPLERAPRRDRGDAGRVRRIRRDRPPLALATPRQRRRARRALQLVDPDEGGLACARTSFRASRAFGDRAARRPSDTRSAFAVSGDLYHRKSGIQAQLQYSDPVNTKLDEVIREALSLSEAERAEVAGALLESIEPPADAEIEQAWAGRGSPAHGSPRSWAAANGPVGGGARATVREAPCLTS